MRTAKQRTATGSGLLERFSRVVESIYEAGLDPSRWPVAVKGVANLHHCPGALLLTPSTAPAQGGFIFPHGVSEADLQPWAAKYVHHDPWVAAARAQDKFREGGVFLSDELLPRAQLEKTLFYREYLVKINVGSLCTGVVFDGSAPPLLATSCTFFNRIGAPSFSEEDKALHSLTVKHLSRALGTMYKLRDAELRLAANLAALDRISAGVLLLGERGNVVFANASAMTLVKRNDGLLLSAGNPLADGFGWLRGASPEASTRLEAEIARTLRGDPYNEEHFSRGVRLPRHGKAPYVLQVSPLARANEFCAGGTAAAAIAFISEIGVAPRLDPGVLSQVFGLTAAETALAQEILGGDSLEAIARRLGVSENTVKTQLQSIFAKTDTHRQSQLVRMLMSLVSTSASGPSA